MDITARTAHDGALKWTRAPSTPRAARSILATFPSTCALPSGGRWSLRRVLQRPGRQRKRSSAKEQLRVIADEFFGALLTPVLQRAVRSAAVGDAASALVRHLPRRMRSDGLETVNVRTSRGTTVPVTTPYYREETRPSGEAEAGTLPRLGGAGHLRPVHAEAGLGCKPRGRHAQLAGRSAGAAPLRGHRPGYPRPSARPPIATLRGPERPSRARRAVCWTA